MSEYFLLYWLHVSAVLLSGSFFVVRGFWMLTANPLLQLRFVRISPHVIDTVLLGSAVALAILTRQYPLTHDWLTVKFIALLAYIGFGMFALRRGRTRTIRVICLVAALTTFAFMVSVAFTRSPLGVFSLQG